MRFLKLFILFLIVLSGCKTEEKVPVKENPPSVVTKAATDVSYVTVNLNGEVIDEGFTPVTDKGFVYSDKNTNPSLSDSKIQNVSGKVVYSAILDKLPINTKYYYKAYATNSKSTSYGEVQTFTTLDPGMRDYKTLIVEVKTNTGRIWMDRNLGATQAATSPSDELAYGDLYQWGRGSDGHQLRNSSVTSTLSNTDVPSSNKFIAASSSENQDWRKESNNNLWQGVNGINNPCPKGFRLPTSEEWAAEFKADNNQSFNHLQLLRLPTSGWRNYNGDLVIDLRAQTSIWSSTINNRKAKTWIGSASYGRGAGMPVRCIKD